MPYEIYRNITILEIKEVKVTPNLRPSDISGDTYAQDPYTVQKAYFSNHKSATIHHMEDLCQLKQMISVAVDENHQVIAMINHVSGKEKRLNDNLSENIQGTIIFFILLVIPIGAFGLWLIWRSIPYFRVGDQTGGIPLVFGIAAWWFAFFLIKQYRIASAEDIKALAELRAGAKKYK